MEREELYHKLVVAIASNYRANELNEEIMTRICDKAWRFSAFPNHVMMQAKTAKSR